MTIRLKKCVEEWAVIVILESRSVVRVGRVIGRCKYFIEPC